MITAAAWLALPAWVRGLIVRVLGVLILVGFVVAGVAWFAGHHYDQGYAAREGELQATAQAYALRVAKLNGELAQLQRETTTRVKQARAQRDAALAQLEEALTNEPDFAAIRMPDRLHALRVQRRADVARAAAHRDVPD
jgi:competence protein ComGC